VLREDPLDPARGCMIGILCGVMVWVLVSYLLYLLVK